MEWERGRVEPLGVCARLSMVAMNRSTSWRVGLPVLLALLLASAPGTAQPPGPPKRRPQGAACKASRDCQGGLSCARPAGSATSARGRCEWLCGKAPPTCPVGYLCIKLEGAAASICRRVVDTNPLDGIVP